MTQTIAAVLAGLVDARLRCLKSGNAWSSKHEERIHQIEKQWLPSGSGIDAGTSVNLELSSMDELVFSVPYHHMNDVGMYDGWTDYTIVVRPAFSGVDTTVRGRDRNWTKDYLAEVFRDVMSQTCEYDTTRDRYMVA